MSSQPTAVLQLKLQQADDLLHAAPIRLRKPHLRVRTSCHCCRCCAPMLHSEGLLEAGAGIHTRPCRHGGARVRRPSQEPRACGLQGGAACSQALHCFCLSAWSLRQGRVACRTLPGCRCIACALLRPTSGRCVLLDRAVWQCMYAPTVPRRVTQAARTHWTSRSTSSGSSLLRQPLWSDSAPAGSL